MIIDNETKASDDNHDTKYVSNDADNDTYKNEAIQDNDEHNSSNRNNNENDMTIYITILIDII